MDRQTDRRHANDMCRDELLKKSQQLYSNYNERKTQYKSERTVTEYGAFFSDISRKIANM